MGLFCPQASWQAKTLANPGVTGVIGVVATNVPVVMQVTGSGGFPIQIIPGGGPGPLGITATLSTTGGTMTCVFRSVPPITGTTALGAVPWTFVNQQFQLLSGPLPFCGVPMNYFTASFSPVIDVTAAGATVYVN